jgi:hypothetical protein
MCFIPHRISQSKAEFASIDTRNLFHELRRKLSLQFACEKEWTSVSDVLQREIQSGYFVPESIQVLLAINDHEFTCGRGSAENAESSCMSYRKYPIFS